MNDIIMTAEDLGVQPEGTIVRAHWLDGSQPDHFVVRIGEIGGAATGQFTLASTRQWLALANWGAELTVFSRPFQPTEPAHCAPSREEIVALFHAKHLDPCTGWCETQTERVLDLLANAPTVEQIRAQLIAEISADFDQWAIRWKRGGYGSNPVDEQTIAFAADALHWLRALAPTQPTPVFEAMGLPTPEVPNVGGGQHG